MCTDKYLVSFVDPNYPQGPIELNAYYLPYSVGTLWAYCDQFKEINSKFELGHYVWRRDQIDRTVELLKDQHVIGFSVYLWNAQYCQALSEKLKQANPDILIVWGGPQPPIEKSNIFETHPYVDIVVKTEGEISFKSILLNYETRNFKNIPGILINRLTQCIDTGNAVRINDIDVIPSPYLNGYFDKLMQENPDVLWTGIFETNRGCPYQCTFCDWGSLTYSKIKKFNIDRVYAELEWFGKNGIDFIAITDANFGIFPERDIGIAEKLVEVQQKYHNPKSYTISWAKNQKSEVIEIVKLLMFKGGNTAGLNVSVQSMDENTLDIIKRKNLKMNQIEEVFDECEVAGIPLYTELILGLPGETLESWKENYYKLYAAGNHTGITNYQAQLLENAEMNLTQRNLYCLKGTMVYDYLPNYETDETGIDEAIEIVSSTLDLPKEKMLEAQMFSWFQNTFHINGLTTYLSRFLLKHINEQYSDFYDKLYKYVMKDKWIRNEHDRISNCYNSWLSTGTLGENVADIEGLKIHGWNLTHSTLVNIHSTRSIKHIMGIIESFIKETYSSKVEKDVLDGLVKFQNKYLIDPDNLSQYPITERFDFDFLSYIQNRGELNVSVSYVYNFPEDKDMSFLTFCQKIFFDRRRNFGKAWISKL